MSTIRTANLGPLTGNTASVVDPSTPSGGIATMGPIVSFASQTASGTTVPFTGIPAWAKRVTLLGYGLSTNGTSPIIVQLGSSGGFTTSGYAGVVQYGSSATYVAGTNLAGVYPLASAYAANSGYFVMQFYLVDAATNKWVTSGYSGDSSWNTGSSGFAVGVALSGTLTQIRLNTVNGTDTFDAGTVNVMYE